MRACFAPGEVEHRESRMIELAASRKRVVMIAMGGITIPMDSFSTLEISCPLVQWMTER
jgi:hypothetical protein